MPRGRKSKRHHAIVGIQNELAEIQKRIDILKSEGVTVSPEVTAAFAQANTDLDTLLAQKPATTDAEVIDAVNQLDAKIKAAITPAA